MSARQSDGGHVALVGAGPGDPELLTLKALRALAAADVVLCDDLVSAPILDLVRRGAMRVRVGKRAGRHSASQEEINALMVRLARSGRRVVRLKAGDPSIFGRAGEEISALAAAQISFEIIPGVTTASALAAGLEVSLTQRAMARSVRFITAHGEEGGLPANLDWQGLCDPATTLIVYMSGRTGAEFARRLLAAGANGGTPVILARDVSRPTAEAVETTLEGLAAGAALTAGEGPVVTAIGTVFSSVKGAVRTGERQLTGSGSARVSASGMGSHGRT
ncbi:MAG: uroporphyrinogen-III C-methyltransferase [Alphaproteobacteria bacterium]|nr:uroporphyrinogen-III C-methyltransferase [Alphaproteobacteria bacterium]